MVPLWAILGGILLLQGAVIAAVVACGICGYRLIF